MDHLLSKMSESVIVLYVRQKKTGKSMAWLYYFKIVSSFNILNFWNPIFFYRVIHEAKHETTMLLSTWPC